MEKFIRNIRQQSLVLEDSIIDYKDIVAEDFSSLNTLKTYSQINELKSFLCEWFSNNDYIIVQSSGSTSSPKAIRLSKQSMIESAIATCSYLDIKAETNALLCMNLKYIGAKMMIVRALVNKMRLIIREASRNPLKDIKQDIDLAAMVPMQIQTCIEQREKALKHIQCCIIGGSGISADLEKQIALLDKKFYSSYGMTETASHIALRHIAQEESYKVLDGIQIESDKDNRLIIKSSRFSPTTMLTNDIVRINKDNSFDILGRYDNVIISGSVKIQAEELEKKILEGMGLQAIISSKKDKLLGEKVVLVTKIELTDNQKLILKNILDKYEYPKEFIQIKDFPLTENGKISRIACKKLVNSSDN